MNAEIYKMLTDKERLFADLLLEIATTLHKLERDITSDIDRTLS